MGLDDNDTNDTNDLSDANNLCIGCMQLRGEGEQCLECGWVEGTQPNSPLYLSPRTELNNRYVVGRVLGHGGFGITYLGWDQELHLKVAIKEYLPDGLGTRALGDRTVSIFSGQYGQDFEYGLEKFLAEARTLARFQNNSNIVSIFNYFKENGTAYIVMEYVEGISLKQHLQYKEDGRMPLYEAMTYIMPVADALSLVHAEGILHRDISPDNIYVTKDYHVKLLDFGASRKAMSEVNKSLSVLLKPGYAPIEQYSSRGVQGPWTDEYALAATMYKLLSGKTPPESIDRMQGMKLESLTGLGLDLPASVETVLTKALSVQPQERYQSIEEFTTELNKALSVENSAIQMIDNANKAGIITDIRQQPETVPNEQPKIEVQPTGIQAEEGSPNLQPVAGRVIKNKKALIAVVVGLILVLPSAVYGFVSFNKPKLTSQIVSTNKGKTDSVGATPTTNQTETVKNQESQTMNLQKDSAEAEKGIESFNSQIAVIKSKGFTPFRDNPDAQVADGFGNSLYTWGAGPSDAGDGSVEQLFFFIGNKYLGTDTFEPHGPTKSIIAGDTGSIIVTYAVYQKNDQSNFPTGKPFVITYHWNGQKLVMNAPFQNQSSADYSFNSQIAVIKSKGFTPFRDNPDAQVADGFGNTLYTWGAGPSDAGDGSVEQLFFFIGNKYLGTDTLKPHGPVKSIIAGDTGSIIVTYAVYQKNDPFSSPTGEPFVITYHWDGQKLVMSAPFQNQFPDDY